MNLQASPFDIDMQMHMCLNGVVYAYHKHWSRYQLQSIVSIDLTRANCQEWLLEWAFRWFRLIKIGNEVLEKQLIIGGAVGKPVIMKREKKVADN